MSDMKKTLFALVLFSGAAAAAAGSADGAVPPVRPDSPDALLRRETFYDVWIRDRLSVGLSVSFGKLTDDDRPRDYEQKRTFLGYINRLDLEDEFGWSPAVSWLASDYVRLGLSWQSVEARTWNFPRPGYDKPHSDGIASASGFVFSVEGSYPSEGGVWRPHAGLGLGLFKGDFDADVTWWNYGWKTEGDWIAAGRPRSPAPGKPYRYIDVDDAVGVVLSAGVAWRPRPRFELDLSLRRTWLEPDCEFGYEDAKTHERSKGFGGEFTFDSLAVALTASYVF